MRTRAPLIRAHPGACPGGAVRFRWRGLPSSAQSSPPRLQPALLAVALASLFLLVHNHAISLLPESERVLAAGELQSALPSAAPVAAARLPDWPEDDEYNRRSRLRLFEDGRPLLLKTYWIGHVLDFGQGRWTHRDGRVLFSARDNSDPRSNGRTYSVRHPVAYGAGWSVAGLIGLVGACALLWKQRALAIARPAGGPSPVPAASTRVHLASAVLLLTVGLYCNTGTLAPYAITHVPELDPESGYLAHIDKPHQKGLFQFLEGADRAEWAGSVLLRRILFPVAIWPFAHPLGFEVGGVIGLIFWNIVGFAGWLAWVRRRWGDRAAIAAGWLGALYPGAAYWGGLPQVYGLIFPLGLWLGAALHELDGAGLRRTAWLSLAMGIGYLAYDFFVFFMPATAWVLMRRGAWKQLPLSLAVQAVPLAAWLAAQRLALDLPVHNSNTGVFGQVLAAYLHPGDYTAWWQLVRQAPAVFLDVFFGANFLFLPWLFLALVVLRMSAARPLLTAAETGLLLAALALFLFNNLAPAYRAEWPMRGTWIARLYQPVFVVLLGCAARWWSSEAVTFRRFPLAALFAVTCAANALIVFGPIAHDPLQVSGRAYYQFYNHSENHWLYRFNLRRYGRHPLGW